MPNFKHSRKLGFLFGFVCFLHSYSADALINAKFLNNKNDLVRINFNGNEAECTGFYVNPTTILTAAHCLYKINEAKLWEIRQIAISNDDVIKVKIENLIPMPSYEPGKSECDVGIIVTSPYVRFEGSFVLDLEARDHIGTARLMGAGKIDLENAVYGRSEGTASYLRLGSSIYSFGKSRNDVEPGNGVSIAPNDSGGPVLDEDTGKVIGVGVRTTVMDTYGSFLPAISVSTALSSRMIREFIEKNTK